MPRTMQDGICQGCGNAFSVPLKSSTRPYPKYCSRACFRAHGMSAMRTRAYATLAKKNGSVEGHKKPRIQICEGCHLPIDLKPSEARRYKFCSRKCAHGVIGDYPVESRMIGRGALYWQRKYARERFNNKCASCGYDLVPEILQLHHKDHNPRNRSEENLVLLCPNCHETEHFKSQTGRFGKHSRKRKDKTETYAFRKYASDRRITAAS